MTNLKVTSKKYNDKDVLEVDNLGEAVNEEIEAGKIVIPSGEIKLYNHRCNVSQGSPVFIDILSTTNESFIGHQWTSDDIFKKIINMRGEQGLVTYYFAGGLYITYRPNNGGQNVNYSGNDIFWENIEEVTL